MTSKEKINSIKSVINEFYHDMNCKGNLTECANECWKEYQQFCEDIKQDLERLEKFAHENASLHTEIESLQSENEKMNKQLDVFFDKLDKNTIRAFDLISYDLIDENTKLKKVIEILKRYVAISKRKNEVNGHFDISCIYSFGSYKDITQQEYDLLKEYL